MALDESAMFPQPEVDNVRMGSVNEVLHPNEFPMPSYLIDAEAVVTDKVAVEEGRKAPFFRRIGNIAHAAKTDVIESDHQVITAATGIGVAGIQVLSRFQASWVFVPKTAVEVFKQTQSPTAAAVAGGLAFGGWCLATGGLTAEGLSKYPKALDEFNESFPSLVDFFSDSLPGLDKEEPEINSKMYRIKSLGKSAVTHVKRGLTVMGSGTAVYAGTASAKGFSRKEAHVLNLKASTDGAVATGALVYGLARVIEKIGESDPVLADKIVTHATDMKLWLGVAGVFMAESNIENRLKRRRKNRAISEQSESAPEE